MEMNPVDLDKILHQTQKTAGRLPLVRKRFLRSFSMYLRENMIQVVLGGLFLAGVLIGTLLVRTASAETIGVLKIVLGGYLERRKLQAFSTIAVSTFFSIFVSLLILFFCGFCTIAPPIILAVPLFKGLGYGFSIGTLYAQNGTAAIGYVVFLMMPAMLLSTLLIITACRISLRLSVTLFRSTVITPEQTNGERLRRYCVKYLVFTGFCLLIALTDAALFYRFSGSIVL